MWTTLVRTEVNMLLIVHVPLVNAVILGNLCRLQSYTGKLLKT